MPDRHLQVTDVTATLEDITRDEWTVQVKRLRALAHTLRRERDNAIEELYCIRELQEATQCAAS